VNIAQIIIGVITALGGLGATAAAFSARSTNRKLQAEAQKSGADAASVLSTTAVGLLAPMREQIVVMEGHLRSANARIQELETQVRELTAELEQARRDHARGS